jgi:hypothetical protein
VCSTVTSTFIAYGLEHQPSPRGWAESSPHYMGQVRPIPRMVGPDRAQFFYFTFFLLKEKFKNIYFPRIFMSF